MFRLSRSKKQGFRFYFSYFKVKLSDSFTLGVVGGPIQSRGRVPPSGVEEAVLPGRDAHAANLTAQDHQPPQGTESGTDPAGVQREAEGHQTFLLVSADGEPDGGDDATDSWVSAETKKHRTNEALAGGSRAAEHDLLPHLEELLPNIFSSNTLLLLVNLTIYTSQTASLG